MKQELKFINFYKLALLKGCAHGMAAGEDYALRSAGAATSAYITPVFDTGDDDGTFNRLVIDGDFSGAKLEVIVAASQSLDVFIGDIPQSLDAWLADPGVSVAEKILALQRLPHVRAVNTRDILLHGLAGRYVWALVAAHPIAPCDCELRGLRLELPRYSFLEYFPEIYWNNDFFERYIAVFQSMFLDLERRVGEVPRMLDYRTTPDENVEYLAGWLGLGNSRSLFTTEQLRHLIANIGLFQGAKGTRRALEEIILLVTGIRPRIVEYFQWARPRFSARSRQEGQSLYGETCNHFCVILDLTRQSLPAHISERDLAQLIESYSVMGSHCKLVLIRICSHTDAHCYLDVNSALSVPETAGISSRAIGGHYTLG